MLLRSAEHLLRESKQKVGAQRENFGRLLKAEARTRGKQARCQKASRTKLEEQPRVEPGDAELHLPQW